MKKTSFELSRVFDGGQKEEARIVPVQQIPWDTKTGRRGFLGASIAMSAALMLMKPEELSGSNHSVHQSSSCKNIFAHKEAVLSLAVSPDGKYLISGGFDRMIKIWSLPSGALIKRIKAHRGDVRALAVSPKQNLFASGGSDKTIKLWKISDGAPVGRLKGHKGMVNSLAFSPDGLDLISTGTDNKMIVWDADRRKILYDRIHSERMNTFVFAPEGDLIAIGLKNQKIELWNYPDLETIQTLTCDFGDVISLAYGQDGSVLASGANSGRINLWREDRSISLEKSDGGICTQAIDVNEQRLIDGGVDKNIRMWDLNNDSLLKTIRFAHEKTIRALKITPDGKNFISASDDKSIKIWNLENGSFVTCLLDLACSSASVKGVKYSGVNEYGQIITYTLPCGSPIPSGARCTCNCVPGSIALPKTKTFRPGPCKCNQICTCVPIYR